jgi:hypothetical protein
VNKEKGSITEPLGKWHPYYENRMHDKFPDYSICETLRQIYQKSDDEQVCYLARVAITMAKHMVNKLQYYHDQIDSELWTDKREAIEEQLATMFPDKG